MDDAGKDVKARSEAGGGHRSPTGAVASAALRSASLMQDHRLLTASVWCGLVFSLAVVLTAVNLIPPAPVGYRVSTQVIASPQRLEILKRQLVAHSVATSVRAAGEPTLLGIQVQGGQAQIAPAHAHAHAHQEPLTLVEVHSLWPARTSTEQVHQWLNKLSEPDRRAISRVNTASDERFARWEVQTAEHYLKHFRHTRRRYLVQDAADEATADKRSSGEETLVSSSDGPPTRFASLSTTPNGASPSPGGSAADEVETRLVRELQRAAAREHTAAEALQEQAIKVSGILSVAGSPHVRPQPGRVPETTVLSILVLAFAGGVLGGWAHHRAQSGGIFYAAEVARNMDGLGLPLLGVIHIAGAGLDSATGEVHRRVTGFRRWAVKRSLSLTELVVLFWCLAIASRLILDPLWRALLWDSPLAALGRLFVGLP